MKESFLSNARRNAAKNSRKKGKKRAKTARGKL